MFAFFKRLFGKKPKQKKSMFNTPVKIGTCKKCRMAYNINGMGACPVCGTKQIR